MQAFAEPQPVRDPARDEAFERLYRTYARDVYRYTLAVLRNPSDAEDITQTTFLNAYRAYRRGVEPIAPRNWLIKIAHNACRTRHLRAVRRPQEVPLEETIAALRVPPEEAPKVEELLEALGRLPFNQRAALVMRELEGRSYAEIAQTLDVSVAAVETLIFRARRTLRKDRSLFGALGAVQLPPSLSTLLGGGAAAVAGGGAVAGSGLLAKAALLVATGLVAGTVGTAVDAKLAAPAPQAAVVAPAPLVVRAATPVSFRVRKTVEIRARRASERLPSIRWVRSSSSSRKAPAGGSVLPGVSGSSQQEATGGAPEAGTAVAAPEAPTASVEPSSATSTANQTTSTVTQATSDVTSQTSAVTAALPPVPPPPPLPVATPSVPEVPSTPPLPPPPPLPDLP